MTGKIVWLLDVDGVLNGWASSWHDNDQRIERIYLSETESYKIRWSQRAIGWIRNLHTSGAVEVVWSTTWCGEPARLLETALGLPQLRDAFVTPPSRYVGDVKVEAARAVLAAGDRLVWTDDMEAPIRGSWLYDELKSSGECLLIKPDTHRCLRPHDLKRIDAFVRLGAAPAVA